MKTQEEIDRINRDQENYKAGYLAGLEAAADCIDAAADDEAAYGWGRPSWRKRARQACKLQRRQLARNVRMLADGPVPLNPPA